MARLAFTVAGAAIGSVVPGVGTALGAQIGGFVGGLVVPGPGQTGPRLTDLAAAPSTHGSPIPQVVGTALVACDQTWVNENKLTERRSSSSAKGGPEVTTYSYFASFAVTICEGDIDAINRIWAGDKLIAEFSSDAFDELTTPETWSAGQVELVKTAFASVGQIDGLDLTIYKGTETQEPDPRIEADRTYAPAYRGLAYMVFEDFPLAKFGNAIPPIRVEVVKNANLSMPVVAWEDFSVAGSGYKTMYDPARETLWTMSTPRIIGSTGEDGSIKIDVDHTGADHFWAASGSTFDTLGAVGASMNNIPPAITPDGALVLKIETQDYVFGNAAFLHMFDATSGALRATATITKNLYPAGPSYTLGILGNVIPVPDALYHVCRNVSPLAELSPELGSRFLYVVTSSTGYICFDYIDQASSGKVYFEGGAHRSGTYLDRSVSLDVDSLGAFVYLVGTTGGDVVIEKIRLDNPKATPNFPAAGAATIATANIGTIIGESVGCRWDRDANVLCIWGDAGVAIIDESLNLISSTTLTLLSWSPTRSRNTFAGMANDDNGFVWLEGGGNVYKVSTSTGEVLYTLAKSLGPSIYANFSLGPHFDLGVSGGVLAVASPSPLAAYPDLVSANRVNLQTACEFFAGLYLPAARIDASGLSGTIHGYALKSASATARAALEDLGEINAFDMAEIDAAITFIPRGGASEGTIAEADLGLPKFTQTIGEAAVLPRRIEVNYLGVESQYQPAQQAWQYPQEIGAQGATVRVQTNQVLTDAEGYAVAARSGAVALIERHEVEFKTSWHYQRIAPASIETVVVDGVNREVKVREIDGAWTLEMRGTLHDAAAYVVEGAPTSTALPAPVLDILSATDFALLDMAMVRDADDDYGLYIAAWPRFSARAWDGAAIYRSTDGVGFSDWIVAESAVSAGQTTNALAVPAAFDLWDRANTITLRMIVGTPTSATQAAVLSSDVNAIAVQAGTDWEIVRFADVTDNGDGTFTLSTLLRGQRGTEHLASGHAAGDRVIFLDANALRRSGASDYGLLRYFGAATFGENFNAAAAVAHTNAANGKRPYSVAHLVGRRDTSSNVTLTWTRRSRVHSGPWPYSRPLGEASESYQVEIYNPSTGLLADTQTVSSPTYTLTAAANAALFGSLKTNVHFHVSQVGDWGAGTSVEVIA